MEVKIEYDIYLDAYILQTPRSNGGTWKEYFYVGDYDGDHTDTLDTVKEELRKQCVDRDRPAEGEEATDDFSCGPCTSTPTEHDMLLMSRIRKLEDFMKEKSQAGQDFADRMIERMEEFEEILIRLENKVQGRTQ